MADYCKVLIIDDEFIMRQGMKHMLDWEKEGFQIVGEASNGQEGLLLVEEREPDIVLADIVMPVIDGIEFSEIIGKRFPSIQLIILSSYDKFEYVKTTLLNGASDYILKPTLNPEILLSALHKAVGKIPGMQLPDRKEVPYAGQVEKVLLGFKDHLDEVIFSEYFTHTLFRLLVLNVREAAMRRKEDMVSIQENMETYYKQKEGYTALPVFLNEGILCIVLNYKVKDEIKIIQDAEEAASRLKRIYPRTFLVMSQSFSNMQDIKQHFQQEISREISRAFYYPNQCVLMAGRFKGEEIIKRFEFDMFTRLLNQRRFEEALSMFSDFIEYLLEKQMEEEKLKNLSRNLLYNYLIELENAHLADCDSLKDTYFTKLEDAMWADRFQAELQEIKRGLLQIVTQNAGAEDERIMEMKQYVASHYQESLELSDIADKFGLSYHYLSSYFRQTAKEGFSEYLNRLRIAHAMDLLNEGRMSIAEIGCCVGYSEHSYFCRVFKKITGDTPSSFRRKGREKS